MEIIVGFKTKIEQSLKEVNDIVEKNTFKSQRRMNPKGGGDSGQPEPLKGTQKTRKQNRKGQTDGEG